MNSISVAQARAIDRDAVERLGMPSILLMENASRVVAEAMIRDSVLLPHPHELDDLEKLRVFAQALEVHVVLEMVWLVPT